MKFCVNCGSSVDQRIPEGDNRARHVCSSCGHIHYLNPKIVAGALVTWDHQVLLCRRAIEPRYGYWTLPAGFMENAETTTEAAIRETWEEAEAKIEIDGLYTMIDIPHIDQVHLFFRAHLMDCQFGAGQESLETRLFSEANIPWTEIAFPTVKETLKLFFQDRQKQTFPVHVKDIRIPLPKNND